MNSEKAALVLGAGGFIGTHLVADLKQQGFWVRGADLKYPEYSETEADEFLIVDLATEAGMAAALDRPFNQIYQLAADMGGAGYLFTGENDASVMLNSSLINLHLSAAASRLESSTIFFASSACVYPEHNQLSPDATPITEDTIYPAFPDSEYGWEKLFSERVYLAHARNMGLDVRIGRFHNIFGPLGAWDNGKEKVPAAMCRKVAQAEDGGSIEIWGDGEQTRSFLFIEECLAALRRLMASDLQSPVNIGSEQMISINDLARMVMAIAGKSLELSHIDGPQGVRGRSSDNRFIQESLGWKPQERLEEGLTITYAWIEKMANKA